MANAGLPQGFVRFGTVAHMILKHTHESGETSQENIIAELGLEPREVGMNLTRLIRHRFLRRIGKLDPYLYGVRTQRVLVLFHAERGALFKNYDWKKKTTAERTRVYRARKKKAKQAAEFRKSSIFAYGESLS